MIFDLIIGVLGFIMCGLGIAALLFPSNVTKHTNIRRQKDRNWQ